MYPQDYEDLATFYYEPVNWLDDSDIYKNKLQEACRLIDKITRVPDCGFVHLIGDEVGDRGQNDYLTLYLIARLDKIGVELDILYSNHGLEFLHAMQQLSLYNKIIYHKVFLSDSLKCSLINMLHLIDNKKIEWKEVQDLVTRYYIPRLKVLNYTYSEDGKRFTLVSHAPIGIETVYKLANNFQIKYQDKTVFELALTIDQINQVFRTLIRNEQLERLIPPKEEAFDEDGFVNRHYPALEVIWNRKNVYRQTKINNFLMTYVHGHDESFFEEPPFYINLDKDNLLGKFPEAKSGNLNFYINREMMPKPTLHDMAYKNFIAYLFQEECKSKQLYTSPILFNFKFVNLFEFEIDKLIDRASKNNASCLVFLHGLNVLISSIKSDRNKIDILLNPELFAWIFSQPIFDLNQKDNNGNNLLHRLFDFADSKYVITCLESQIKDNFDFNAKGKENLSILGLSVARNKPEITTHLLKNYADRIQREEISAMHEKAKSITEFNKMIFLFENILNSENIISEKEKNTPDSAEMSPSSENLVKYQETLANIVSCLQDFYSTAGSAGHSMPVRLSLENLLSLAQNCETQPHEKNLQELFIRKILEEKNKWICSTSSLKFYHSGDRKRMEQLFDTLISFFDPTLVERMLDSLFATQTLKR